MTRAEKTASCGNNSSEHWLRFAVNGGTEELDASVTRAFGWPLHERIQWLSPVKDDHFAEYYDQELLDRLGLPTLKIPLRNFWPSGGPRSDALARTNRGKVVLVKAKAQLAELASTCRAKTESRQLIERSLAEAKSALGTPADANWLARYYQYANRLPTFTTWPN